MTAKMSIVLCSEASELVLFIYQLCQSFRRDIRRVGPFYLLFFFGLFHIWDWRIKFSTPCSPVLCFFYVYSLLLVFSFFLSFGVHMFSLLDGLQHLLQSFSPRGITISVSLFVFTHFPDLCSYFFIPDLLNPPYYHRPSQHNFLLQTAYFRNMFSKSLHPAFVNLSLMLHIKIFNIILLETQNVHDCQTGNINLFKYIV